MTSFTRKLYSRDPAAALAFYRQNQFEQEEGKHANPRKPGFYRPAEIVQTFGRRGLPPKPCTQNCGLFACFNGCKKHSAVTVTVTR